MDNGLSCFVSLFICYCGGYNGGKVLKILNLYSGIGGNRKMWGEDHEITAVEMNEDIAAVYRELFPNDKVVVGDAHQYLMEHFKEFDFIWTSPPCQSHSSMRQNLAVRYGRSEAIYPDMSLYQEIIFLKYNFKGKYVVENVKPYYVPLIESDFVLDRHLFWTNVNIPDKEFVRPKIRSAQIPDLEKALGYDLSDYKLPNKRQVLRNCVLPDLGEYILECVENEIK